MAVWNYAFTVVFASAMAEKQSSPFVSRRKLSLWLRVIKLVGVHYENTSRFEPLPVTVLWDDKFYPEKNSVENVYNNMFTITHTIKIVNAHTYNYSCLRFLRLCLTIKGIFILYYFTKTRDIDGECRLSTVYLYLLTTNF